MRLRVLAAVLLLAACKDPARTPPPAATTTAAPADAGVMRATLLEPGREPRATPAFVFVPGRAEAAVLEIDSTATRGSEVVQEEHVTIRLSVRYTARDTVELVVRRAETTAKDIPRVGSAAGMRFVQTFTPWGALTAMPEVTPPPAADPRAAEYVQGAVMQMASCFLPVVPAEPIGEGARWDHSALRFTLVAPPGPGKLLVVERRGGHDGPTTLATGETVYVREEQTYRMEAAADGLVRHAEALLVASQPADMVRTTRMRFDVSAAP